MFFQLTATSNTDIDTTRTMLLILKFRAEPRRHRRGVTKCYWEGCGQAAFRSLLCYLHYQMAKVLYRRLCSTICSCCRFAQPEPGTSLCVGCAHNNRLLQIVVLYETDQSLENAKHMLTLLIKLHPGRKFYVGETTEPVARMCSHIFNYSLQKYSFSCYLLLRTLDNRQASIWRQLVQFLHSCGLIDDSKIVNTEPGGNIQNAVLPKYIYCWATDAPHLEPTNPTPDVCIYNPNRYTLANYFHTLTKDLNLPTRKGVMSFKLSREYKLTISSLRYVCHFPNCTARYKILRSLKKHLITHEKLSCPDCGKPQPKMLEHPLAEHPDSTSLTAKTSCGDCHKKVPNYELPVHHLYDCLEPPNTCNYCLLSFDSLEQLHSHKQMNHEEPLVDEDENEEDEVEKPSTTRKRQNHIETPGSKKTKSNSKTPDFNDFLECMRQSNLPADLRIQFETLGNALFRTAVPAKLKAAKFDAHITSSIATITKPGTTLALLKEIITVSLKILVANQNDSPTT